MELLHPPRSKIITFEQQLLHDIIRGIILYYFRLELAERGSRRCCVSGEKVYELHHEDPEGTHIMKIDIGEWPAIFEQMVFDMSSIRDLFIKVARSYGIDPGLIDFPQAVTTNLNYDENFTFRPHYPHHGSHCDTEG